MVNHNHDLMMQIGKTQDRSPEIVFKMKKKTKWSKLQKKNSKISSRGLC